MKPRYTNQSTERILRLARSFPCLARKLEGWHPAEFDPERFLALTDGWSHGELLCAMFIVSVWDPGSASSGDGSSIFLNLPARQTLTIEWP
jgi:hypothetical protein